MYIYTHSTQFLSKYMLFLMLSLFRICLETAMAQDMRRGLVACYPFDGDADDYSGNANNGMIRGASLTTGRSGLVNGAYNFDGQNDYIEVSAVNFRNNNYSFSLWANPKAIPLAGQAGFIISIGSSRGDQAISINHDYTNANSGYVGGGYNGIESNSIITTGRLPDANQWVHLVVTRDNNNIRFYRQGVLVGTASTNGASPFYGTGAVRLTIGGRSTIGQFFNGSVDEVTIYNRAINDEEVRQLFTVGQPCSPLPPKVTVKDTTLCGPGTVTLSASSDKGGATFRWYDAAGKLVFTGNPFSTSITTSTSFQVEAVANGMTSLRDQVSITVNPIPEITLNLPDSADECAVVLFRANASKGKPPYRYEWNLPDSTANGPSISYQFHSGGSQLVTLKISDAAGCQAQNAAAVRVKPDTVIVPNVFTPDGNDINDFFLPYAKCIDQYTFRIEINDRWGRPVAIANGPNGWDGRRENGQLAANGVYYYAMEMRKTRGPQLFFRGWVMLLAE
jgi:gliding motility-associated-like protein